MTYYLLGNLVLDENLRPMVTLSVRNLGAVKKCFVPLRKRDARRLLDVLWEETWALSRGAIPKGEVEGAKVSAQLTYEWWHRIALQVTPCPDDCPKKPPHVHVTQERIKELVIRSKDYARFRRMLDATLGD